MLYVLTLYKPLNPGPTGDQSWGAILKSKKDLAKFLYPIQLYLNKTEWKKKIECTEGEEIQGYYFQFSIICSKSFIFFHKRSYLLMYICSSHWPFIEDLYLH